MDTSDRFISEYFGENKPLSNTEIDQLAVALQNLAMEGIPIPKHLLRHEYTGDLRTSRHYGHALNAIPVALDRLGQDREKVVVALISRLQESIMDHHDQVSRKSRPLNQKIMQRYFDVVYLLGAAKPKTEESVTQVAGFLRSEKQEVHEKASEMLEGAPYFPIITDRLLENVAQFGIRQWPNGQSRALASFAYVPEVHVRLMHCFHSEQENLRYLAVMTAAWLKERAGSDIEAALFAIADDDTDRLQGAALDALHEITPRNARLRQLAVRLIHSDKYWVRGYAIKCLDPFQDRESIEALLDALLDEGGPDFPNPISAAKILQKMPLDAGHDLTHLISTLESLLGREDRVYEEGGMFADFETLLAVAQTVGHLGAKARPALSLIESCSKRPYITGTTDPEEWRKVIKSIEAGESTPD